MKKMLPAKSTRFPISVREFLLLVAVVVAAISWYKEYERSRRLNEELESARQMFGAMLELEEQLRQHPEQKSARLNFTNVAGQGPKLRWSMAVDVLDDKPPADNEQSASSPAAAPPAATSPTAAPPAESK